MGVHNLWKVIKAAGETQSLMEITLRLPVNQGRDIPCIGVDISPCMDECIAATMPQGVNGQLPGGPLYIFFYKLIAFLKVRATFVFVFDGPERPKIKRGSRVRHHTWWAGIVEELILAFGFRVHYAPGEAEAELAKLNHDTIIDAVLTSDSDALVFGAEKIIRPIPRSEQQPSFCGDEFELYSREHIWSHTHLTNGGLILFALLNGGDYHEGILHCGPKTALGLARCGYGDQLSQAIHQLDERELHDFLRIWQQSMCRELATNSQGYLATRQRCLAASVEATRFPDLSIVSLYTDPIVSESASFSPRVTLSWTLVHEPSLIGIRSFCEQQLQWTEERIIRQKFKSVVFPALILQMLHSPLTQYNHREKKLVGPTYQVTIQQVTWKLRKGRWGLRYQGTEQPEQPQLTMQTSSLIPLLCRDY